MKNLKRFISFKRIQFKLTNVGRIFFNTLKTSNHNIKIFVNTFKRINNRLNDMKLKISNSILFSLIFKGLIFKYDALKINIIQTIREKDIDDLKVEDLFFNLINEFKRLKENQVEVSALFARGKNFFKRKALDEVSNNKRQKTALQYSNCKKKEYVEVKCGFKHSELRLNQSSSASSTQNTIASKDLEEEIVMNVIQKTITVLDS